MPDEENRTYCSALTDPCQTMEWSLFPQDSSNVVDRCRPVFSEPIAIVVSIRRPANTAKHFRLARTCQRILRNQAPRAGPARLVPEPLAQEEPAGSARKVGSAIGSARRHPLNILRSNPPLVIHGANLKLRVRVHAMEKYKSTRVLCSRTRSDQPILGTKVRDERWRQEMARIKVGKSLHARVPGLNNNSAMVDPE